MRGGGERERNSSSAGNRNYVTLAAQSSSSSSSTIVARLRRMHIENVSDVASVESSHEMTERIGGSQMEISPRGRGSSRFLPRDVSRVATRRRLINSVDVFDFRIDYRSRVLGIGRASPHPQIEIEIKRERGRECEKGDGFSIMSSGSGTHITRTRTTRIRITRYRHPA